MEGIALDPANVPSLAPPILKVCLEALRASPFISQSTNRQFGRKFVVRSRELVACSGKLVTYSRELVACSCLQPQVGPGAYTFKLN